MGQSQLFSSATQGRPFVTGTSTARHSQNLVDKPELIGPALAQVVSTADGREVILGQCWVAAPNQLITCGHVVDRFVQELAGLFVYFPASGRRYPVQRITLHPSFVRQPDGLVKFDAAVLSVQLTPPDSLVLPLPFAYENSLRTNQPLWSIRYPVHLGQLSAALEPLPQDGRFLGLLRKHDNFHLLHDVPLAPGDSGAPIIDGKVVVAMHCGNTATLPGLNLPTTSIQLALWVDAFRDLGLPETRRVTVPKATRLALASGVLIAAFLLALVGTMVAAPQKPSPPPATLKQPTLMPVRVNFNQALDEYSEGEQVEIHIVPYSPESPCYAFVFFANQTGDLIELYPGYGNMPILKDSARVDRGNKGDEGSKLQPLEASIKDQKLYVIAVDPNNEVSAKWAKDELITEADWFRKDVGAVHVKRKELLERIAAFQAKHPDLVLWREFSVPKPKATK